MRVDRREDRRGEDEVRDRRERQAEGSHGDGRRRRICRGVWPAAWALTAGIRGTQRCGRHGRLPLGSRGVIEDLINVADFERVAAEKLERRRRSAISPAAPATR